MQFFLLFHSLALFLLSPLFRILFQQLLEHYTQRSVEKLHCFPFVCSEISDTQLNIKLKSSLESFAVPCSIHSTVAFCYLSYWYDWHDTYLARVLFSRNATDPFVESVVLFVTDLWPMTSVSISTNLLNSRKGHRFRSKSVCDVIRSDTDNAFSTE